MMNKSYYGKVVDFRLRPRTPILMKPWGGTGEPPAPHFEEYVKLYRMYDRVKPIPISDLINIMKHDGINVGVVCGGSILDNREIVQEIISNEEYKKHFVPVVGVNPSYGIKKNLEIMDEFFEKGFVGINVSPYIWGIPANDPQLYPLYAQCERRQKIAIIHGSLHYNKYQNMWLGDPKYFDELGIKFPSLNIVMSHAGNGFGVLPLSVAQRHENIWMEYSALWPKYLPDITIHSINTYLKDRCLFGTDYPLVEFDKGINAWDSVLKNDVKELFFYKNAERLISLCS